MAVPQVLLGDDSHSSAFWLWRVERPASGQALLSCGRCRQRSGRDKAQLDNINDANSFGSFYLVGNMGFDPARIPGNGDDTTSVAGAPLKSAACLGCTTVFAGTRRCSTKGLLSTGHSQRRSLFVLVSLLLSSISCLLAGEVRGSSAVVASCDAKHKDLVFPLKEGSSANFSCSKGIGDAYPSLESGNYCETKECTSVKSLTSVPELKVTTSSAQDGVAIVLNKAPSEHRVLYFVCSPTGSQPPFRPADTCVVKITAEPDPKPGERFSIAREFVHSCPPLCGGDREASRKVCIKLMSGNQSFRFKPLWFTSQWVPLGLQHLIVRAWCATPGDACTCNRPRALCTNSRRAVSPA